jgi:predicted metal-dependent peptidase
MTEKSTLDLAQTAFIRARIRLMSTNPFYAHLVMKMPLQWMENVPGGLSCTDGTNLMINPGEFIKLTVPEQISVLVHEVLHCAAGHLFRRGSREPFKWNVAGDTYIANVLEADRFSGVAAAEAFLKQYGINRSDYRNMTTDQIYDRIPDSPQQHKGKGKGQGQGNGQGGGDDYWQGGGCYHEAKDSAQRSADEAKWKQAVIEAGQLAGNVSGAWRELVKAAMPKVPFHLKLYEYLNRGIGGDTSWDSLNRRYLWQGLYLPCDTKVVMGRVAFMVDTSGSMSTDQLALVFGYVRAFREQHPCQLDIIQCDYDVVDAAQFHTYEEFDALPSRFTVIGRGGTSFNAPFKLLREKRIEPKVAIYCTDGYGSCTEKAPPYPVLWVVVCGDRSFKPPFGEVVYADSAA